MTIAFRAAGDRFVTREAGRETFHGFSFGRHYDPRLVGFAAMTAHNDENLPPDTGYDEHPHRDIEIVTWVVDGALRHTDASGRDLVLAAGAVMRTSAGRGIVHAERAAGVPTRFLQTWLRPDSPGVEPSWQSTTTDPGAGLLELVGPAGELSVGTRGARLLLGRQQPGWWHLPPDPLLHLFVVSGRVEVGERSLGPGDAALLSEEGGRQVSSTEPTTLAIWAFG